MATPNSTPTALASARDLPSPPPSESSFSTQQYISLALAIRELPSIALRYLIDEMRAADVGAAAMTEALVEEAFPARMKDPRYPLPPSIWQIGGMELRVLVLNLCLEPGAKAVAIAQLERISYGKDGHGRYRYDVAKEKSERKRMKQLQQEGSASSSESSSGPTSPTTALVPSSMRTVPTIPGVDGGEQAQQKKKLGKRQKLKKWWNEVLLSQEFALGGPYYSSYS